MCIRDSISWLDAREMASRLGVRHDEIAIGPMFDAFRASLAPQFAGRAEDTRDGAESGRLPVVEPFDWPLTLRMIGAHAVPGGERLDPESHTYTRVLNGTFGPLVVTIRAYPGHLSVWLDGGLVPVTDDDTVAVTAQVRHWLDLDLDGERFGQVPVRGGAAVGRRWVVVHGAGLLRKRFPDRNSVHGAGIGR